jgi:membrane protease YdiL (CAAX protease family)
MRLLEFTLFYIGLPLLLWVTSVQTMLLPILWLGALFAGIMLGYGRDNHPPPAGEPAVKIRRELAVILLRFIAVAFGLTLALYFYHPEWLFWLPRKSLGLWGLIIVAYPLLSVLPQALIYRLLFERRYAKCFSTPGLSLFAGTLVFCLAHLPFNNFWALLFTLPGGVLFLRTYRRMGSLSLSTLEHALYGDLLFTIGWGACLASAGTQRFFLNL